jgi:hypothetical protein
MDLQLIRELVERMRGWGIIFDKGLSNSEIEQIESENNFRFPEDLRALLQCALPLWEPNYDRSGLYVVERFPNWRTHASLIMRQSRRYLLEGLRDTVKYCYETNQTQKCWLEPWGVQPVHVSEALSILDSQFATAPVLIPVYVHRFIPGDPLTAGNPIFSVAGVDIIHYGHDLADYFNHEFSPSTDRHEKAKAATRYIRFWGDFVYGPRVERPQVPPVNLQDIDLDKYSD